jgi:hypothetical protein
MSVDGYKQGQAYGASRVYLWLLGDLKLEPQFAPMWKWCLAHNLAVAAGLCRSFLIAARNGVAEQNLDIQYEMGSIASKRELNAALATLWHPGCGKAAP